MLGLKRLLVCIAHFLHNPIKLKKDKFWNVMGTIGIVTGGTSFLNYLDKRTEKFYCGVCGQKVNKFQYRCSNCNSCLVWSKVK